MQLKEGRIRLADITRQLSQLRLDRFQMEEDFEQQLHFVQEARSEIERALKTETDLETVEIVCAAIRYSFAKGLF